MKKILLVIILILTSYSNNFATPGCRYTSGYIYIVPGGSGGPGVPNYTYTGQSYQRILASSYCVVVTGGSNSCYINYSSGSAYGVAVDYTALPCTVPIDSELYILIIATGALSYYLLKNKPFSA